MHDAETFSAAGEVAAGPDQGSALTRAKAGIYTWIARAGQGLLYATPAAMVTAMTAAALAPVLIPLLAGTAGSFVLQQLLSQLGNVGAEHVTDVIQDVVARLRREAEVTSISEETVQNFLERRLEAELAGPHAAALRTEITQLLHAIDGVGTALDAAFRSGIEGLDAHIGQTVRLLSETVTEFHALRGDVLNALTSIQGDITRTLAWQQDQSSKLDRLNIQLALLRRELVFDRPAAPRPATVAGAPGPEVGQQPAVCPYPGLAAFSETDAFWFHGRERLTAAMINRLRQRLRGSSPLIVVGASGAGKSSVLRAGLIPELDTGGLAEPGSQHWPREIMTPGTSPLRDLAHRLGRLADVPAAAVLDQLAAEPERAPLIIRQALLTREERSRYGVVTVTPDLDAWAGLPAVGAMRRLILVIDQFEEVFTQCPGEERKQFIDAICAAARGTGNDPPAALVVISLRAGFVEHCTAHPPLEPALRSQFIVGPMNPQELHAAIEAPARDADLSVEPGLAAAMLSDLGAVISPGSPESATYDPGSLPLLAHALRETWERRQGGRLTVTGYHDAGGIKQAVAKKANDVYNTLDHTGRQAARQLLEHMVSVRSDAEDTRRRLSRSALLAELPAVDAEMAGRVLDLLERQRLVTADHDAVQIAHEALLRHWPLLAGWLEENREWLNARQQLTEHAHEWDDGNRHPDRLLHGAQLSAVHEQLRSARRADLGKLETTFLQASERRQARTQRTRTAFTAVLTVAVVVAAGFAVVAQRSSHTAENQQAIAQSRQLAAKAEALSSTDPATSLWLSLEAYRIHRTNEAISSMLAAQSGYFTTRLISPAGPVNAVAYDPAVPILASAAQNDEITIWNTSSERPVRMLHGRSAFFSVAFDNAGRFLAGAEEDGAVVLWNARSGQQVTTLRRGRLALDAVAFSPDGRTLATAGWGGTVALWRTDTGKPAGSFVVGNGTISGIAFSPDGRWLAAACADHDVRIWDLIRHSARPRVLTGHTDLVRAVAFSPDSARLASGGDDGTVRLWDVGNGKPRGVFTGGTAPVRTLAFSKNGALLASGGEDDAVRLWDVSTGTQVGALTGPASTVAGVAFSPDGRTLASADADATVGLWNIAALPRPGSIAIASATSAPHGLAATSGAGGPIEVWQRRSRIATILGQKGQPGAAPASAGHQAVSIAFSTDGRMLAASARGTVTLWNVAQQQLMTTFRAPAPVNAVAFRPSTAYGRAEVIGAGSTDDDIYIWGPRAGGRVQISGQVGPVDAVAFSPDGTLLADGSEDGTILLARVTVTGGHVTASVLTQASGQLGPVDAVAFSPDGQVLASASTDHTVLLWHVGNDRLTPLAPPLVGHSQAVISVSFSSDGHLLASSAEDHTIRLWDVRDPSKPSPFATITGLGTATSVAFEPGTDTLTGADTLIGAAGDGTALFWATNADVLASRICAFQPAGAAPALAPYLPGVTYHPLCPAAG